jgi:hypothetical protein
MLASYDTGAPADRAILARITIQSTLPCQHGLRLGEPEGHLQSTVQLNGRGQLSTGLLPLAGLGVQRAKAEVAVGLEWTHAEFFGQGEGFPVVGCGWLDVGGLVLGMDVTQKPLGVRLVATFPVGTGEGQGALGKREGVLQAASQQIALTQLDGPQRQIAHSAHGRGLRHALL